MSPRHRVATLTFILVLVVRVPTGVAADAPGAGNIWPAHPAALFDPTSRCPQLAQTAPEDAAGALIVFEVSPSGHPSHAVLQSSSSDEKLDAAALSCVMKLRFQPPTLIGEGTPIASRQQIAFKWAPPPARRNQAAAGQQGSAVPVGSVAAGTAAATTAGTMAAAGATSAAAGATNATAVQAGGRGTEVRVCVDEAGKLAQAPAIMRSSGDAAFDAAVLSVARAGAGSYRAATADGKPAPGCIRLTLTGE